MPAKRKYNIKGTNDFLVLGLIFFFLCLWAIKDAWFPSDKVLKKHPLEVVASFETAGSVEKVFVDIDDSIIEEQVIAKLRTDKMAVEFEQAKSTYTEAKKDFAKQTLALKNAIENGASGQGIADIQAREQGAKTTADEALAQVTQLRMAMESSELKSPSKGKIREILVGTHTMVEAGETAIIIDPKDHFYLFNKSLAIFSFFAFWVFLAIHILAR
jgi:multidrug resistance efflux pump